MYQVDQSLNRRPWSFSALAWSAWPVSAAKSWKNKIGCSNSLIVQARFIPAGFFIHGREGFKDLKNKQSECRSQNPEVSIKAGLEGLEPILNEKFWMMNEGSQLFSIRNSILKIATKKSLNYRVWPKAMEKILLIMSILVSRAYLTGLTWLTWYCAARKKYCLCPSVAN